MWIHMATLPQPFAIRSNFPDCRVNKSPGAKYSDRILRRNEITNTFDERKLLRGQTVLSLGNNRSRNLNFEANATPRAPIDSFRQMFTKSQVQELGNESTYLFRTEFGGLVNVFVRKKNLNRTVRIEVTSLELRNGDDRLVLNWGVYRGDSSSGERALEAPLEETSSGRFFAELEIESKKLPCYLSFRLRSLASGVEIRTHRETNFCAPIGFGSGRPTPLGLSFSHDGSVNFSVFPRNAERVVLCLFNGAEASGDPVLELDLDPYVNRTGDLWHASFENSRSFSSYCYRVSELDCARVVLDPYSKIIADSASGGRVGLVEKEPVFDWGDDVRPNLPLEKLMIYRLNVKRFTEHKSGQLPTDITGTFSGVSAKLEHLKYLGVNAVLLEPIFPFDETKGPYFPFHFFSPMNVYGPSGTSISAIDSMKEMVKKMHASGIEVLLEVVFPQTGSPGGVDDLPGMQRFILDILHYWATEFRVDGFCFVNASSLLRGSDGKYLSRPPLVEAIAFDPLLLKTKIVADRWDPLPLPLPAEEEACFPHWKRWAEMNARFCRDVRSFLRGGKGLVISSLATRICGSGDVFSGGGRGPAFSLSFVARNSGLPLVDLVSFSAGSSQLSWNCGHEGPTNRTLVLERRIKQIRNFLFVLYVSLGVPVLNMGDECGQSTRGSLEHSARKPYDWSSLKTGFGVQVTQFIAFLSSLRRNRSDLFQKREFWKEEDVEWRGTDQSPPRWEDPSCKFLAVRLRAKVGKQTESDAFSIEGDMFLAFNSADCSETVVLPQPGEGIVWHRLVDTALLFPGFFSADGEPVIEVGEGTLAYEMKSHSCALFEARLE